MLESSRSCFLDPEVTAALGRTVPRSHQRRTRLQWTEELLGGRRKFKAGKVNL